MGIFCPPPKMTERKHSTDDDEPSAADSCGERDTAFPLALQKWSRRSEQKPAKTSLSSLSVTAPYGTYTYDKNAPTHTAYSLGCSSVPYDRWRPSVISPATRLEPRSRALWAGSRFLRRGK